MAKKKKRQGHWCWYCRRVMSNERFSGKGHARHLCRECTRARRAAARECFLGDAPPLDADTELADLLAAGWAPVGSPVASSGG